MSDLIQTPTLAQVARWLQEFAGLNVQGSEDAITLRDPSGHDVLSLRSAAGGQAVALMANVARVPDEARLAAVLQMHLLRLCADPQDLHGMRVALTGDGQRVVLLDPALQALDGPALIARCELAMEMAQALGAEIDVLAQDPSLSPLQVRDAMPIMWP
jgi:hypothetical protein